MGPPSAKGLEMLEKPLSLSCLLKSLQMKHGWGWRLEQVIQELIMSLGSSYKWHDSSDLPTLPLAAVAPPSISSISFITTPRLQ